MARKLEGKIAVVTGGKQQGMLDYMATTVPLGQVGEPDEVAKAGSSQPARQSHADHCLSEPNRRSDARRLL